MSKPRLTSIDQLAPPKLKPEEHEIGDFSVLIWPLTGREIQRWSKENATIRGGKVVKLNADTATARLLAAAIKDDNGQRYLSVEDINRLMDQSAADVARLEKAARRLSGLDEDEEDDDADDEEGAPAGNGSTRRTPSSTAWPVTLGEPALSS